MPMITCPQCGTERIVVEGKRKNCRKCGQALSTIKPKPAKPQIYTRDELIEKFPEAVKEIRKAAVEEFKDTFSGEGEGEGPSVEAMTEHFPELVKEIADGAAEAAGETARVAGEEALAAAQAEFKAKIAEKDTEIDGLKKQIEELSAADETAKPAAKGKKKK